MTDASPPQPTHAREGSIDRALSRAIRLDRALEGNLPCIICGYDLKGVTIRGSCPECGTLVRATILYTVDPKAEEFRPLIAPRITALAVVAWVGFGLIALLAAWWVRLADGIRAASGPTFDSTGAWWILLIATAASGLSLIGMIRPTRGAPWRPTILALIGMALYVPLILLLMRVRAWDAVHASPYFGWSPAPAPGMGTRELMRLGIGACLAVIVLAVRPNGRELVRRSIAMRTGRVDRQTLLALVGAIGLAALGDVLRMVSMRLSDEPAVIVGGIGTVFIAIGSLFMTLGLASAVVDAIRIRSVILLPPPSLGAVLGDPPDPDATSPPPAP